MTISNVRTCKALLDSLDIRPQRLRSNYADQIINMGNMVNGVIGHATPVLNDILQRPLYRIPHILKLATIQLELTCWFSNPLKLE